jgi:hypothetical protein
MTISSLNKKRTESDLHDDTNSLRHNNPRQSPLI